MKSHKWYLPASSLFLATTLIGVFANPPLAQTITKMSMPAAKAYKAKDYSSLLGMIGFSDKALDTHFKLYQGYVTNINLLSDTLSKLSADGRDRSPEYAELKRRFGWEFDGMRLHELYFENLGGKVDLDSKSKLYAKIVEDFGSYDRWKADFIATGAMRGVGWAVLYQDPQSGQLFNTWINEHDLGHLASGKPILIMDVFEHAYMIDYLIDRVQYIETFFKNINWDAAAQRYEKSS